MEQVAQQPNIAQVYEMTRTTTETMKNWRDEWQRLTDDEKAWYRAECAAELERRARWKPQ